MRRIFTIIVSVGFLILCSYTLFLKTNTNKTIFIKCNFNTSLVLKSILNINVKKDSIFFIDTSSRKKHEILTIKERTACAIESAAFHHPNRSIYLIYMFPNETELINIEDKYLKTILNYENINVVYAKINEFVKNTEVEDLFKKELLEKSEFSISHSSDIFRVMILLKFGGIYMDTDVIVLKSMNDLNGNFIGEENRGQLNGAVIGFNEKGKDLLSNMLKDLNENYDPYSWSGNGPGLFTKWVKILCKTDKDYFEEQCDFLKILPRNNFYPIYYPYWNKLFKENYVDEVLKSINSSYLVHFWNKLSADFILDVNSNAPYLILAKNHCPQTFNKLNNTF